VETLKKNTPPSHSPDCQYGQWMTKARNF